MKIEALKKIPAQETFNSWGRKYKTNSYAKGKIAYFPDDLAKKLIKQKLARRLK